MAPRRLGANNPSSSKRLWVLLSQTSISTASNPSNFQRNRDVATATPQDSELRHRDLTRRARNPRTRATEVEAADMNEWRIKMEQMKRVGEQEMIVKHRYSSKDLKTLSDVASRLGLYFRAYNNGKTLVLSKVPLPNYRADLDEHYGTAHKKIQMSTETERRVGILLDSSKVAVTVDVCSGAIFQGANQSSTGVIVTKPVSMLEVITAKEKLSVELKSRQEKIEEIDSLKPIKSVRDKLPAFKVKFEFLKAVAKNQVPMVSGQTGCGKTTQFPQFILEEEISSFCGADCSIICTQPRRISAIAVASQVSYERGESLGETVGYQIRLESKRSAQTRLLFCTTGILLRQLVQDPNLTGLSHLLVDEIHQRGIYEDFFLIILRDLLPRRPDLRLILMSATINANMFSKYFGMPQLSIYRD